MLKSNRRRRRAALAIELLFALPILLAVIFASVQFSLLLSARQQVTMAAREGARIAALGGSDLDVRVAVSKFLGSNYGVTTYLSDAHGDPVEPGDPVTVVVSQPTAAQVPEMLGFIGFSLGDANIVARAVMIRE